MELRGIYLHPFSGGGWLSTESNAAFNSRTREILGRLPSHLNLFPVVVNPLMSNRGGWHLGGIRLQIQTSLHTVHCEVRRDRAHFYASVEHQHACIIIATGTVIVPEHDFPKQLVRWLRGLVEEELEILSEPGTGKIELEDLLAQIRDLQARGG